MAMWHAHIASFPVYGELYIPFAVERFASKYAPDILRHSLRHNFLLHLINLWELGLINAENLENCLQRVDKLKAEQVKCNGSKSNDDGIGNGNDNGNGNSYTSSSSSSSSSDSADFVSSSRGNKSGSRDRAVSPAKRETKMSRYSRTGRTPKKAGNGNVCEQK